MSAHTPGPWAHGHDGHGAYSIETDDCDGLQICYVRNEANAILISAAPDLLEVLQEICRTFDASNALYNASEPSYLHRKARAAIAKATGAQQ